VNICIDSVLYFERDFADVYVMREDKGESSYTQMTEANYDELTDDINEAGGGGGAIKYLYWTEAEFEAAKDSIPVGATVVKMYEYPSNGYSTGRPDLWPVGVEIDFGQNLFGQRFTGNITSAAAGVLNSTALITFPDNSFRIVDSGGQWQPLDLYAQFEPLGFNINSSDQWAYVWINIENKTIEFRTRCATARTNRAYDVWATYNK
jgi:hypothetical protein